MQAPIIVFSHVKKTAVTIPSGPAADKVLAAQRDQQTSSGRPPG
jgi:hypothetical protein